MNDVRLRVVELGEHVVKVRTLTGDHQNDKAFIPKVNLDATPDQAQKLGFNMSRTQFPLKLAWAMTINKSQGQTLERVGLMLPEPVFGTACSMLLSAACHYTVY